MAKYEVIKQFRDLKDDNHVYNVGNKYPRNSKKADEARVKELIGKDNAVKEPVIKEIEEDKPKKEEDKKDDKKSDKKE